MKPRSITSVLWLILPAGILFSMSENTLDPVMTTRTMAWGLGVAVLALISFGSKQGLSLPKWISIGFGGFVLMSFISTFYAVNSAEAYSDLTKVLLSTLTFVLMYHFILRGQLTINQLSISFGIGFIVIMTYFAVDLISWQSVPNWSYTKPGSLKSIMANKNLLSSALFLCIPWLLLLAIKTKAVKLFALGSLVSIALAAIVILQTRAVWLALAACILVAVVTMILRRKLVDDALWLNISVKKGAALALTGILLIATVMFVLPEPVGVNLDQVTALDQEQETSSTRFDIYAPTSVMIADQPLIGHGLASCEFLIPTHGQLTPEGEQGLPYSQCRHNDYLWIWAESGIIALGFYLLVFLVALWQAFRLSFSKEKWRTGLTLLLGIIGYMVIAVLSFPKESIFHQLAIIGLLAVCSAEYRAQYGLPEFILNKGLTKILALAGVFIGLFSTYAASRRFEGEKITRDIYAHNANGEFGKVVKASDKAFSKFYTVDPVSTPLHWYKGTGLFQLGKTDEALKAYKEAVKHNPNHLLVHNDLGSCYAVHGEVEKAIKQYKKALQISPRFAESLCNLAAIYQNQGDNNLAFETLYKCPVDVGLPALYPRYTVVIAGRKLLNIHKVSNKEKQLKITEILSNEDELVRIFKYCVKHNFDFIEYLEEKDWVIRKVNPF